MISDNPTIGAHYALSPTSDGFECRYCNRAIAIHTCRSEHEILVKLGEHTSGCAQRIKETPPICHRSIPTGKPTPCLAAGCMLWVPATDPEQGGGCHDNMTAPPRKVVAR